MGLMSSPVKGEPTRPAAEIAARHVFLVGFMGSGKTTVGRALAGRINRDFVDLNEVIVDEAGTSIREIFRNHGEVGFRARERAALRNVLNGDASMVVATGGGTFIDATMREWVRQAGRTIYLQASPDVLVARISAGEARFQRPLVSGPHPEETVRRVLTHRTPAYEECDFTVRTDLAQVEHVVEEIVRALRLERPTGDRRGPKRSRSVRVSPTAAGDIPVKTATGNYPVHVRTDGDEWLAAEIRAACAGSRVAVVSDETVGPLHGKKLVAQLRSAGKVPSLHTFAPGEQSKVLSTAATLYDGLLTEGITRNDAIVAIGGGVVSDVAGFVASTLHGGIAHVHVPTTTVAAVDATVGGRTAVNTRHGPNQIGTRHPPKAVLIAAPHLATQSRRRHANGLAMAMKLAATLDAAFFDALVLDATKLLAFEPEPLVLAIQRAIALRALATNGANLEPAALRFGQTIGRAIESADRQLLAGETTALGMLAECEWAESESTNGHQTKQLLASGLSALEMPTDWHAAPMDPEVIGADSTGDDLRLAHVAKLGTYEIRSVPISTLVEFVRGRRSS